MTYKEEYSEEDGALHNVSIDVAPGEVIAIVGHSGAGKTTFGQVLQKLLKIDSGDIIIDGTSIQEWTAEGLCRNIASVQQNSFAFDSTVYRNITFGNPKATPREIISSAKQAGIHDFIKTLQKRYHTIIGERGVRLSGGQRQRISISRALVRKCKILLLDEFTSSVDMETEKYIQDELDRYLNDVTAFIIAHRFSTIRRANRILVLEKGRVAELGTHEELMQIPNGIYRNMFYLQNFG